MDTQLLSPDGVANLFTRRDGSYHFARWARPIVPVLFGVEDDTITVFKAAFEALSDMAHHPLSDVDPDLGANLMVFFCEDWDELLGVPNLDRLIEGLALLIKRLNTADANQYRVFRFDPDGAITAVFVLLRMDGHLSAVPAMTLALSQGAQMMLLWSDTAFQDQAPVAILPDGAAVLRPEIGALLRAAYDPVMPAMAQDASHALRLHARIVRAQ